VTDRSTAFSRKDSRSLNLLTEVGGEQGNRLHKIILDSARP